MMTNSLSAAIVAAGVAIFGALGLSGLRDIQNPPSPTLELVSLAYRDGHFHQSVVPTGADVLRGAWSAKITRGNRLLCDGGGVSPYDRSSLGSPKVMTPSKWTGDDCPPLQSGDKAIAVWEWQDGPLTRSISGEIEIP